MQTIQNHVTSLPLAKKLVEAGIKIKTHFAWAEVATGEKDMVGMPEWEWRVVPNDFQAEIEFYPAPLASELGEVLPSWVENYHRDDGTFVSRLNKHPKKEKWFELEKTMPDAMAKMLIYLKEEGLI